MVKRYHAIYKDSNSASGMEFYCSESALRVVPGFISLYKKQGKIDEICILVLSIIFVDSPYFFI